MPMNLESLNSEFLLRGDAILGGLAIAMVITSLVWFWRVAVVKRHAFQFGVDAERVEVQRLAERLANVDQELAIEQAKTESIESRLHDTQLALSSEQQNASQIKSEQAALQARFEETNKAFAEKEQLLQENSKNLKLEFSVLANKLFEEHGKKLSLSSQEQLGNVLSPFKIQMAEFKDRVEKIYHTESKDRASLMNEVQGLQKVSERMNVETENLTKALKGDKRLQGNWGELVLERILEDSGLRRDYEYVVQSSRRNSEGDLKRPDIIVHLPGDKDVVIDSKVSLNAYEVALSAEQDVQREMAIREHISNLRNHVKKLSSQNYDELDGIRSLDFVLMFIPIESAFTLAMEKDQSIFTAAFEQRIVIVSPTTLMMTLRIIHNVWRYEKQNKNAEEIASRAGALYDKLRLVVEEMDKLGQQVKTLQRTYNSAYGRMVSGRGNLVRQVEQFRELGAKVKQPLPKELLEAAESENLDSEPQET